MHTPTKPHIPCPNPRLLDFDEADLAALGTPEAKAEITRRFVNRFRRPAGC